MRIRPIRHVPALLVASLGVVLLVSMLLQANAAYASVPAEQSTSERQVERTTHQDERNSPAQPARKLDATARNRMPEQADDHLVLFFSFMVITTLVPLAVPVGLFVWYWRRSRRLSRQSEAMGADLGPV